MSEHIKAVVRYAEQLRDIMGAAPKLYDENARKIEEKEKEIGDLVHALEFISLNELQESAITSDIRKARRSRRRRKDQNAVLKPLADYIKGHPKVLQELREVFRQTEQLAASLENRRYHPRIRKDLEPLFAEAAKQGSDHERKEVEQLV